MSHPLHQTHIIIDGVQYARWNRENLERMRAGGLTAVHVTICYWENAIETMRNIGQWNQRFQEHADLITPVQSVEDIHHAKAQNKTGIIFGLQNCSPIEDDITFVELFHQLGVRVMQLSYNNQTLLASGCYEAVDSGITRFGKVVIAEMNRVGMSIDMSHSGDRSTLEAIELSERPITISHANPRFFHDALRNKSDDVLRALGASGGMLGFSLYPLHLKHGSRCTLSDFCAMVARTAEMIGVNHIGIGSDLCTDQPASVLHWMRNGRWANETDYGEAEAGSAAWPKPVDWFKDASDMGNLTQGLLDIGFNKTDVSKIMGGNWLRFFTKTWGS